MSATTHTPGPLFVRQPETWPFNILIVDGTGNEIFFERRHAYGSNQSTVAEVMAGSCFSNPETRAAAIESNARQLADACLRSAAPELLAALRGIYEAIDSCAELTPEVMRAARAAIAKAEGGSQ